MNAKKETTTAVRVYNGILSAADNQIPAGKATSTAFRTMKTVAQETSSEIGWIFRR